jgi:hypothetical protein
VGILALGKTNTKPKVSNQVVSDVVMAKAKKEYYDCIQFLRMRGVNVDQQMASKIKEDIISHRIIMEC